ALRQEDDAPGTPLVRLLDALCKEPLRRAPRDVAVDNALTGDGVAVPIRVIEALHRRLASRTEISVRDRVIRIPLYLRHPPGMRFDKDAAARRTLPAGARIPGRHTGHDIIGGD